MKRASSSSRRGKRAEARTRKRARARISSTPPQPTDPGLQGSAVELALDRKLLQRGYYFDAAAADHVCRFIEEFCVHSKDEFQGRPFVLAPWQRRILRRFFGWKKPDGTRRYTRLHVWIPRKNGKSTWAAAIALYLLVAEGTRGADIYCLASAEEQARYVFDEARRMVNASAEMAGWCAVYTDSIFMQTTLSKVQVMSSKGGTKHGSNPSAVIIDELHAIKDRELYDVMTSGSLARRQPVEIVISTAGYDRQSVAWQQWKYAEQVRDGVVEDPEFLAVIYAAGPQDDWRAEATWMKANPNLGTSITLDRFRAEFKKAQASPADENRFKRLHLNLWTEQDTRYLQIDVWDRCAEPKVPDDELAGKECYAGLDLSSSRALSAFVRVFPRADLEEQTADGKPVLTVSYDVRCQFWMPKDTAAEREREDRIPYRRWIEEGLIVGTEGNMVDYDRVYLDIAAAAQQAPILELAYDRMFMAQMINQLQNDGLTVVPFNQGFAGMSAPLEVLTGLVVSGRLRHGGHPVLRWNAANMAVKMNAGGKLMPARNKGAGYIDGMVALLMALGRAIVRDGGPASVYDTRGILRV